MYVTEITEPTIMKPSVTEFIHAFFKTYRLQHIDGGEIFIMPGENPVGIAYIESGSIEQYDFTKNGDKIIVNIFKPGAFFPVSWALNQTKNTFFYGALEPVSFRQAPADKTLAFLRNNPDILLDLLSRVYKGTDALQRRSVFASHGTAAERLLFELLVEAYRFGVLDEVGATSIKLRQLELSARTGLARETISRELAKLEQDGVLARQGPRISFRIPELETSLDRNS